MIDTKKLDELVERFCDALPPAVKDFKEGVEENFKAAVKNAFVKLDLVSRDEFDAQVKVLERTREKVEALEKELQTKKSTAAKSKKPKSSESKG